MKRKHTAIVLAAALLASTSLLAATASAQSGSRTARTAGRILYHDGQVMTGWSNVYFIWYGCWTCGMPGTDPGVAQIVGEFVATFGNSAYARILTTYPDGSGAAPYGSFVYSGAAYDSLYSHGASLTMTDVEGVISDTILSGALPLDLKGIYVVLVSPDVTVPGLDAGACHYHGVKDVVGAQVRYAALNNPRRMVPGFCGPTASDQMSAQGNWVADTLVSMLAYEINATVTNPSDNGWFDRYGLEAPDKCAGTYGPTYKAANGATVNVNIGGHEFLLHQNWVNAGKGYCGLHQ